MDCQKVKDALSAYLDNFLDKEEEEKIRKHLQSCSECQKEYEELKLTMELLQNSDELSPPANFRNDLRERLLQIDNENQDAIEEKSVSELDQKKNRKSWLQKSKRSWRQISAVAVVLLLLFGASKIMAPLGSDYASDDLAYESQEQAYDNAGDSDESLLYGTPNEVNKDQGPRTEAQEDGARAPADDKVASMENEDRKVIKEGFLKIEVDSVSESLEEITAQVEGKGGYIQSSSFNERRRDFASLVVRVPIDEFSNFTDEISQIGKVQITEFSGRDVTEEYFDTEARLNTLKTQEERLLALLEKGESLEEILEIEKELQRVREGIERQEGRLRALNDLVQLATLRVELTQSNLAPDSSTAYETPELDGIFQKMQNSFIESSNKLVNFFALSLVFLGGALPYLALIAMAFLIYYWTRGRYFKNKR